MDFGADEQVSAVAVTGNGEIVAIGSSTRDQGVIVLAKYTEDGSLDPGFGQGGRVVTSFGDHPYGEANGAAVLLQANGGIVVGGSVAAGYEVVDFALARYTANGEIDPTFGTDGTILAAGTASVPTYSSQFAVARFTAHGALDRSFGSSGVFLDQAPQGSAKRIDALTGFQVTAGGSMLLAGRSGSYRGQASSSLAMKLTPDGTHAAGFPDRVFAVDRTARLALSRLRLESTTAGSR